MTGLLEQTEWEGRIYSGGWTEGSGGRLEVSDKATDEVLAGVGAASPVGVVGQITPWNAPLALALRALAPALALGNAVVLKPDPQTPICGGLLLASILEQAGLPEGLVHVLPGGAETGEAIVTDPLVAMVTFTGSSRVGRRVGQLAGGALKKVSLELGGNNVIIVLDDADVEAASSAGAFGSFFHQG